MQTPPRVLPRSRLRRIVAGLSAVFATLAAGAPLAVATTPPVDPAGATSPVPTELVHPVALVGDSTITITDGRHATTVPHLGASIVAGDGTVVVVGDGLLSAVAPAGTVRTTACAGCRGVVEHGGTIYTGRDPQSSADGFTIATFDLGTLAATDAIVATRTIDADDYPDDARENFDVPLVIGADDAGVVVTYDYQPGGYNSRGGGDLVIARYDHAGAQQAMTIIGGRADAATESPDGRRAAITLGGSSGACVSSAEVVKVDLDTLAVTAAEQLDDDSSWLVVQPLWDADSSLRTTGVRVDQADDADVSSDCGIRVTPWESRLDAAGSWISSATAGTTRWVGPGCGDAITLTPSYTNTGLAFAVTATRGPSSVALGTAGAVALGTTAPSYCDAA